MVMVCFAKEGDPSTVSLREIAFGTAQDDRLYHE